MVRNAGMGKEPNCLHLVGTAEVGLDEWNRMAFRGPFHACVFPFVRPEYAADYDARLHVRRRKSAQQFAKRGLKRKALLLRLQVADVFAERDDQELRPEGDEVVKRREVVVRESMLERVEVSDAQLRLSPSRSRDAGCDKMDIVLLLRARGHSPVVRPPYRGRDAVKRDGVADEEHLDIAF